MCFLIWPTRNPRHTLVLSPDRYASRGRWQGRSADYTKFRAAGHPPVLGGDSAKVSICLLWVNQVGGTYFLNRLTMKVETVENSWMFFKKKLEEVCEEIIPKQHVKQRRNIHMGKEALKLKRKKEKSFRMYKNSQSAKDFLQYKLCRNKLRSLTRRLRTSFEKNQLLS